MRRRSWTFLLSLALGLLLLAPAYALDGWHRGREDGLKAAQKSGKPLLVVTLWGDGV